MAEIKSLAAEALCRHCDSGQFTFKTTEELEDLHEVIGQSRAVEAIGVGLGMKQPGYNMFALGPEGIGKHDIVRKFLDAEAARHPAPDDWCYINNFSDIRKPRALTLPSGRGRTFKETMDRLVIDLRGSLSAAFTSEEYQTSVQVLQEEFNERQEAAISEVRKEAQKLDIALLHTPMGYALAPTKDGKVIAPEVFSKLPEDERRKLNENMEMLETKLQAALQQIPLWLKDSREKVSKLNEETANFAVSHLISAIKNDFGDLSEVLNFLDEVKADIVKNIDVLMGQQKQPGQEAESLSARDGGSFINRYRVNLLVDHWGEKHAPVIYEDEPTFERMIGRIEHRAEMGALITDFTLVRGGALHRANGGYLILDVRKLLSQPLTYEALKRALLAEEMRIEPLYSWLGLPSTITLEPEAIPLKVKVVLFGEPIYYYLLAAYDPEFSRLFKIPADFDERIDRNPNNSQLFARMVATQARKDSLKPLDAGAVAALIEFAGRLTEDSEKISTNTEALRDLMHEADYVAQTESAKIITGSHVLAARDGQIRRKSRVSEYMQEEIERGTILIDTCGEAVGQVNGLSVITLGGTYFGKPSRITARIRLGKGDVVDIEREVKLGGPIHSKGVLILTGYLGANYAPDYPLALSASLVFEQSYGGVEGDSASSAELYALLSALSGLPIRQKYAVTGSVNQLGQVQVIGGVNEKIEGFFDLCAARGLTGDQGVLIPAANAKNLMLHKRVIEAVRAGKFNVFPVETIDQGIEHLTGRPAGKRGDGGKYPRDSVNQLVETRLRDLAEKGRRFMQLPAPENTEAKHED